jgi:hypothetical protein
MGPPFARLHRLRGHRETLLRERSVVVWTLGEESQWVSRTGVWQPSLPVSPSHSLLFPLLFRSFRWSL